GMGDTVQFIRYAALVKARGGRVLLMCPEALLPLLASCPGIDRLLPQGQPPPAFDIHAPLMSLPAILGTTLATVPAQVPYLFAVTDLGSQFDAGGGAFMETAAVMRNLDLVITSDKAIPHLAGALNVPVWIALPLVPDWRWLLHREDSPWYPSMRLFRQREWGNW